MSPPRIRAQLIIGEQTYDVAALRLEEGIHAISHAAIDLVEKSDIDFLPLLGAAVRVQLLLDEQPIRHWTLRLEEGGFLVQQKDALRYRVHCYEPFQQLTHTLDTRKFRNQSAQQIVTAVLTQFNIAHQWHTNRET